ncbi:Insulin-degrading enzyme like [Actinidia chinensis var. chinensis]|uniref:Insulin-degrading enzyme like n=1 Tax=Actinidia chinensis var. chinensis TaxID=1590841 RepID=A0A2R6PD56_ACTCC|nr:Insulin-degrading enzyme like [Actinidia chinensis var. chinensis]
MEEGKDPTVAARTNQSRVFPQRLRQLLVAFLLLCVVFSAISIYRSQYFGVYSSVATARSSFQPCVEELTSLDSWIRPPSNLLHNMTDNELFWRASFVPRIKKYPFKRVPKIAFMFLTKGPLPLAPLWERFFKGHKGQYAIYIHSLPSFKVDFPYSSVFHRRQIRSQVSEWGKMSMCDAERRLLANALLDNSNEWFILLSESCIPLYPFRVIYHYIMKSKYSFMGAFDDPGPFGRGRYNANMAPEVNITQWRKGSQWFEINQKLALSIVEDSTFYPKFNEFCKPACYVDEHYFPTMLTIQAPNLVANRSITWVDWSRGGAHPATFGKTDIKEEFLKRMLEGHSCLYNNQPSSVCFLFARKFAPSALEHLLLVAPKYFGY